MTRYAKPLPWKILVQMQRLFETSSVLQPSVVVPIDSLSFPLVDPTLRLKLHRKWDNIVGIFAMITWSDDLLPAHWTLGGAFAGLRTLIFTRYEGFHETCMAEEVTLRQTELIFVRETVQRDDVPQWVAVRSFMVSMQIMHCNVDSLTGLLACSFCAWMVAIRCCSRTLDRPASSSTSCEGVSSSVYKQCLSSNANCGSSETRGKTYSCTWKTACKFCLNLP